jgi:hypothetical protein
MREQKLRAEPPTQYSRSIVPRVHTTGCTEQSNLPTRCVATATQ